MVHHCCVTLASTTKWHNIKYFQIVINYHVTSTISRPLISWVNIRWCFYLVMFCLVFLVEACILTAIESDAFVVSPPTLFSLLWQTIWNVFSTYFLWLAWATPIRFQLARAVIMVGSWHKNDYIRLGCVNAILTFTPHTYTLHQSRSAPQCQTVCSSILLIFEVEMLKVKEKKNTSCDTESPRINRRRRRRRRNKK